MNMEKEVDELAGVLAPFLTTAQQGSRICSVPLEMRPTLYQTRMAIARLWYISEVYKRITAAAGLARPQ